MEPAKPTSCLKMKIMEKALKRLQAKGKNMNRLSSKKGKRRLR